MAQGKQLGGPVNNRRTWRMYYTATYGSCGPISCTITDKITFRVDFDPGIKASRVFMNYRYFPSTGKFGRPGFSTRAYIPNLQIGDAYVDAFNEGSITKYIPQGWSLKGRGFQFDITTHTPVNGQQKFVAYHSGWGACNTASTPTCKW
ncbi:hypothetical protein [Luteipulveratus mongoliensis]|nr:hypothetical protein [Luteipulveratus mongoliensis]